MAATYGLYYQAEALREKLWFIMGTMRSNENWAFTRTLDPKKNILEFFVAPGYQEEFESFIRLLEDRGYLLWHKQLDNRLKTESFD